MFKSAQGKLGSMSKNRLSRAALIVVLSVGSLVTGWVPGLSKDFSTIVVGTAAYAQSINSSQVTRYAQAVLEMEPVRQSSYREFRRLTGGNIPPEACRRGGLPNDVEYVCKRFFTRSADIIQSNGLSIAEFNEITQRLQSDAGLRQRIQKEMIRQQNR